MHVHYRHHRYYNISNGQWLYNSLSDEIWVEHRSQPIEEIKKEPEISSNQFSSQFKILLDSGMHSDITFKVGDDETEVTAHKAILTARSVRAYLHQIHGIVEGTIPSIFFFNFYFDSYECF